MKREWEIAEAEATPEHVFFNRREFLQKAGLAGIAGALPNIALSQAMAKKGEADPSAHHYPVKRNEAYVLERDITPIEITSTYNNFYEFGSHKRISRNAQKLPLRPWDIRIDGEVEKPFTISFDDLLKKMPLEERLYRHRCVEAWAMAVPWSGFPLSSLVALAAPTSKARYLRMETFMMPKIASGQRQRWYPWPYVEALTLEEAVHELSFIATGVYGKPLLKQYGAPLRLAVPWKYGFKSIKSIVRFQFTQERPETFWEAVNSREYGFWANVNPQVPHPRWSQRTERLLGTDERVLTRIYNGYGKQVEHLYKDMPISERLFV